MASAIIAAPYETSITAAFTAFGEWAGFMESISPAITAWIQAKIPAEQQRVMDRRLRKCKRICRKGGYNKGMITARVDIDFKDLTPAQRAEIVTLLAFELLPVNQR